MTRVSDALSFVLAGKNMDAIRARNREIVVRCPRHGEFSRGDLLKSDVPRDECPECHKQRVQEQRRKGRIEQAAAFFKNASGVPPRFQGASFESYQPGNPRAQKNLAALREYAARFERYRALGLSLILCGKTGTGKTHLACAVLRALAFEHGVCGKYRTAYRAVQEIRASYKSSDVTELQVLKEFVRPDLLVLDEVGVQFGTDAERLLLFEALNGRYEDVKPTIVVSNLEPKAIGDYLGDRVMDRLMDNGGATLVFDWQSHRRRKG